MTIRPIVVLGALCGSLALSAPAHAAERAARSHSRTQIVHDVLTQRVSNGCAYRVRLDGSVDSTAAGELPSLQARAEVVCPNGPPVRSSGRVQSPTPMAASDVDALLGRASEVVESNGPDRCVYRPDLSLRGPRLSVARVSIACTTRLDARDSD